MDSSGRDGMRALVIEDEPVIARVCQRVLTAEGFEVEIAVNGMVAKDMLDRKQYHLFLSDIRTPEMNGIEFYWYLKEEYPELADRVVFTTGDVLSDEVKAFVTIEPDVSLIPKPFAPDELRVVVRETMERINLPVP
ncbi:MAG: response regulator [Dehalococcoidales bacterium]|nr:MAG: response regulator [Dehalococcoidales bacterium]